VTQTEGPRVWPWLTLASVLAAALFALHSPWLSLSEVEVLGAFRSDPGSRVAEAGVGPGAILIWIDTGKVERSVLEDPWVAAASVDRIWPDRLVVEVVERTPVVWIEGFSAWMLVARDGTVLDTAQEPAGGHMKAALAFSDWSPGDRPIDPTWDEVVALAATLRADIGGTLTLEQRGVELWTSAFGHQVRLGNPIDLADKGRTLRALLQEDLPQGATIDVSSPLRPVIVPAPDSGQPSSGT
jgi:cell division protein FtsQ